MQYVPGRLHTAKDGVHPKVVQELLGHASVTTTLEVYTGFFGPATNEAALRINRILTG